MIRRSAISTSLPPPARPRGAPLPRDRPIDGVDVLPFVKGTAAACRTQALFWRSGKYRVVREGDWKLQSLDLPRQDLLFDLKADPTEQHRCRRCQSGDRCRPAGQAEGA